MQIQVLLVSEQTLPNLIPALMNPPELVCLVCTPEMHLKGQKLKAKFGRHNIPVEQVYQMPDTGMINITKYANALIESLEEAFPGCELVLNATGGTKLMSFGFIEAFRHRDYKCIYADTAHVRIETLPDSNGNTPDAVLMQDVMNVKEYLDAQDFSFVSSASSDAKWQTSYQARLAVAKYLAEHAIRLENFFPIMNGFAAAALTNRDTKLVAPKQSFKKQPLWAWVLALKEFERYGLITWDGGLEIEFTSVESACFLKGIWLEEYAYYAALQANVFDVESSVKVNPTPNTENEFDLLACDRNQLLFIECKTLAFKANENDNEVAYRLDSLGKSARGLFGSSWLLSAREPTPMLIERAEKNHFRIVGPSSLIHLPEMIKAWRPSQRANARMN